MRLLDFASIALLSDHEQLKTQDSMNVSPFGPLARLNLVALVVAKTRILGRAERIASGWWHARVALANLPAVLIVCVALVHEIRCQLDPSSAHLHHGGSRVAHVLCSEASASIQGTCASPVTQDWLILNVDLLINVKLAFAANLVPAALATRAKMRRCCICIF